MLYFAYGAHVNLRHLKRLAPRAKVISTAVLAGHRLVFRGFAAFEPDQTAQVAGVLYEISAACERALDAYEEVPKLYRKATMTVETPAGPRTAMLYRHVGGEPAPPALDYFTIVARYADWKFDAAVLRRARFAAARG